MRLSFPNGRLSRLAALHFSRAFFAEAFSSSGPSPSVASCMSSRETLLSLSSAAILTLPQFLFLLLDAARFFEKTLSSRYPSFLSSSVVAAVSTVENPLLASFLRSSFSVCALNDRSRNAASLIPPLARFFSFPFLFMRPSARVFSSPLWAEGRACPERSRRGEGENRLSLKSLYIAATAAGHGFLRRSLLFGSHILPCPVARIGNAFNLLHAVVAIAFLSPYL